MFTIRTIHKIAAARVAYWFIRRARKAAGKSGPAVITRRGLTWELDLAEGIDFSIYLLGAFEPRTLALYAKLIKPGDIVADIGANIGAHTLPLASLAGDTGRVLAFEPTAYAFRKLSRNLSLNPALARHVETHQAMLIAASGQKLESEIYSSWPLESNGSVHEKHCGRLMDTSGAVALTFDEAVSASGISRLDFIKLDVDGHEYDVLQGAAQALKRFRPIMLMELEPCLYAAKKQEFENMIDLLRGLGGSMTDVNTGKAMSLDAQRLWNAIPDGASRNVLIRFTALSI